MNLKFKHLIALFVALFCIFGGSVIALPQPGCINEWPNPFSVRDQHVRVEIANHIARTTVYQEITNTIDLDIPCNIDFKLPSGAHASSFSAIVDGKTYTAVVKSKEVARETVAQARKQKKVAALAEERRGGILHIELSQVKAMSVFQFQISYIQETVCKDGVFKYDFGALKTNKEIGQKGTFDIEIEFACSADIYEVVSPSHDIEGGVNGKKASFVAEDVSQDKGFSLEYKLNLLPGVPYVLVKDDEEGVDPYFSLLMLPPSQEILSKGRSIVFILDKSGSMKDEKRYALAVSAMEKFIDRLTPKDRINAVIFDVETFPCSDKLLACNQSNKDKVKKFINSFQPVNGTRFLKPLVDVSAMLQAEKGTMPAIVLLTDGEDNEDTPAKFITTLRKENSFQVPMFTFAIGSSVSMALLRSLASFSGAEFGHIRKAAEIDATLKKVADKFDNIIGRNLTFSAKDDKAYSMFPAKRANLYRDELIVAYGRFKESDSFDFNISVDTEKQPWSASYPVATTGDTTTCEFLGQQWASRKMRELLDEIAIFGGKTELIDEVKAISEKFLLTSPYTSLVFSEIAFATPEEVNEAKELMSKGKSLRRMKRSSKKSNAPADKRAERYDGAPEEECEDSEGDAPSPEQIQRETEERHQKQSVERLEIAKKMGGTAETEASVDAALSWLAKTQEKDGFWSSSKWEGEAGHDIETTAYAILALTAATLNEHDCKYSKNLKRAEVWLRKQLDKDGNLAKSEGLKAHAIATWALWEIINRFGSYDSRSAASLATNYLLSCQHVFSAWGKTKEDKSNDLFATTFALRALVAARKAGFKLPDIRFAAASRYLKKACSTPEGRTPNFQLTTKSHKSVVLAPFFAISYMAMGEVEGTQVFDAAFKVINSNPPRFTIGMKKDVQLSWLFSTEIMRAVPGKDNAGFSTWMKQLTATLMNLQDKSEANAGSWTTIGEKGIVGSLGRVGSTAICAMMMEGFYRSYDLVEHVK